MSFLFEIRLFLLESKNLLLTCYTVENLILAEKPTETQIKLFVFQLSNLLDFFECTTLSLVESVPNATCIFACQFFHNSFLNFNSTLI